MVIHLFMLRATVILVLSLFNLSMAAGTAGSDLRELVGKADHLVLMRHTLAPGVGDPANFRLGDCSTQRNLSKAGREQAARIGKRFRRAGLADTTVYSSQWCRCLETARGLAVEGDPPGLQPWNGLDRGCTTSRSHDNPGM